MLQAVTQHSSREAAPDPVIADLVCYNQTLLLTTVRGSCLLRNFQTLYCRSVTKVRASLCAFQVLFGKSSFWQPWT